MDITSFISYLNEKNGWHISATYYNQIQTWKAWYEGYVPSFHEYHELGVDQVRRKRQLFRLPMAKKICEDWASLLLNDRTLLHVGDSTTAIWLYGSDDETGGELQRLQFWSNMNGLVEEAFRSGTGAVVLSIENMTVSGGQVVTSPDAKIQLDYLPAECILPLTVEHGKITEIAFATEKYINGSSVIYLQTHEKDTAGEYFITNHYFSVAERGEYIQLPTPAGTAEIVHTGCKIPWYAIITPAICKNTVGGRGMGQAIYATAIDQLKHVDTVFNNYHRDLSLGGQKIFYNKRLIQSTIDPVTGEEVKIAPDDLQQQLFWTDDTAEDDAKAEVKIVTPQLRAEENSKALQDALNYLSFVCGLGTHHYNFDHGGIVTATAYTGDRQDLIQNANKHMTKIETALISITRAILWVGRFICGKEDIDESTDITVSWDDSYITDSETQRLMDRADVAAGLMPRYKYLMKWHGMTEETARQQVAESIGEQADGITFSEE